MVPGGHITITPYPRINQGGGSGGHGAFTNPNCNTPVLSGSIQTLIDDEEGVGPKELNGGYVVNNGNPYYSDG